MAYNSKYTGAQVEAQLDKVDGKYTKPSTGIPASDLAPDVFLQGEKGEKGDKGDKGDTGAAGTNGKDGVSISSVRQTTTSTADGGNNVVTVTLSNGTTSTFNVKNGSKGSNGTNGTNGKDGTNGDDGATFTPHVDDSGNLSWTNDKGLSNPPTVNIKGQKGDSEPSDLLIQISVQLDAVESLLDELNDSNIPLAETIDVINGDEIQAQMFARLQGSETLLDSLYDSDIPLIQTTNEINGSIL